ncbi:hypothetical protein NMG60_11004817 [Bertholletia excelsa]
MASSSSPQRLLQAELKEAGNRLLVTPSSVPQLLSLLDQVEHLLSKVEQAPLRPMQDALLPVMKALIDQELLKHSDINVKVSVASCVNELTRVTAPDAPYDDERMKEIFKLTVMALKKLSPASGHCYTKAVSILDMVAKVRSCLVMLDLECDAIIVEMFQLFLNTIGPDHAHSIFLDMETIMTLVILESEEISLELLIPLLNSVRKENKNVSPLSWSLGENVLKKCASKLKPYLPQAVQTTSFDLNEFAEIVFSICHDASGSQALISKKQAAKEQATDAIYTGRAGETMDGSSRSIRNNSTAQMEDLQNLGDEKSSRTLKRSKGKKNNGRGKEHPDNLVSENAMNLGIEQLLVPKRRGRKCNSLIQPGEGYNHSWLGEERKATHLPNHRENCEKKVGTFSDDSTAKESDQPEGKETHGRHEKKSRHENTSTSPSWNHERGQSKKKRKVMNQDKDLDLLSVPKGDLLNSQEKASVPADVISTEASKIIKCSKVKVEKGSRKNAISAKINVQIISAPANIVVKKENVVVRDTEEKQELPVLEMDRKMRSRGNTGCRKRAKKMSSGKAFKFSASGSLSKENQLKEASKRKHNRKRTPQKEEDNEMPLPHGIKSYGEELVGCEIKVWWPLDRKFYEGAISSFDDVENKHRVLYADGDEETLDLSQERWLLVEKSNLPEEGKETETSSADALYDMLKRKRAQHRFTRRDKLNDEEQKSDGKSKSASLKTVRKTKHVNSRSSKVGNIQVDCKLHDVDTAEKKNMPS